MNSEKNHMPTTTHTQKLPMLPNESYHNVIKVPNTRMELKKGEAEVHPTRERKEGVVLPHSSRIHFEHTKLVLGTFLRATLDKGPRINLKRNLTLNWTFLHIKNKIKILKAQ